MGEGGLDGVVVAETEISRVDGEGGSLVIRGHDLETLAGHISYEAICQLLWQGSPPQAGADRDRSLGPARVRAFGRVALLGDALAAPDGMDALRSALSHLSSGEQAQAHSFEAIAGAVAVFAAAWARRRAGRLPIPPDASLPHAADTLRMIEGRAPHPARAAALDTYLVTAAEHGMNASTFTARVVTSTGSDPISAVVAALGALKGPLHGGAPGPVLDMLDAIGSPDRAEAWLMRQLEAGRRIMGMGHRIYRVRDPRAAVLERAVESLERAGLGGERLERARAVERAARALLAERHPERRLEANVEFYTAVLLDAIGLPRELFTPTFAVARVAGWLAHVAEQRRSGRLIRPRQHYVGPLPSSATLSA